MERILVFGFLFAPILFSGIFPEGREKAVIYYNDFESEDGKAKINLVRMDEHLPFLSSEGFIGKGCLSQNRRSFVLRSPFLSPHKLLTISLWWALKEDHKVGHIFVIFSLNGKGFISCFVRGGGNDTWCALAKPAAVFQVYHFPGVKNINGIYDFDVMKTMDLRGGVWHNTIVSFSCGREITLYQDGKKVGKWILTRGLREEDNINSLSLAPYGEAVYFDEILILQGVLGEEEVERYYQVVKGLREIFAVK
ncbi:MAG: hypothetical protein RUDDFDWM_000551 [Candidatus Fervidibacterota bacterium]